MLKRSKHQVLSVEHIRARIVDLVSNHEPSKLQHMDALMEKWQGKENDLLKTLCEGYKEPFIKMNPVSIKDRYSIGAKLGTGGFAVVRKCKDRKTNALFALKIINKKNLDEGDLATLQSEVRVMRQIRHEYIVALHDVFDSRSKMCLVLDLLEGGELFDRIIEHGHFTEKNAAECFGQLISALAYLHERHIVHRDLKPENLLFARKCTDKGKFVAAEWSMKLIDFGLAGSCKDKGLKTPCGTPNYVAPEILKRQPYGTMVDMWSAGVILYIILCGFPPFYDENDDMTRLYKKIKNADYDMPSPYWDSVSPEAKDLVKRLLEPSPKKRLTAAVTLEHGWLQGKASDQKLSGEQMFHLKRFQYVKKLRRGVRCILAVLRLIEALRPE